MYYKFIPIFCCKKVTKFDFYCSLLVCTMLEIKRELRYNNLLFWLCYLFIFNNSIFNKNVILFPTPKKNRYHITPRPLSSVPKVAVLERFDCTSTLIPSTAHFWLTIQGKYYFNYAAEAENWNWELKLFDNLFSGFKSVILDWSCPPAEPS